MPDGDEEMEAADNSSKVRCHRSTVESCPAGFTCVDMHTHTNYSDSRITVKALIARAERMKIGIAITDHNEIRGVTEAFEIDQNIPVIPGIEISADDGPHILCYFSALKTLTDFFNRHVKPEKRDSPFMAIRLTTEEILERADRYDCVKVAAHPYGYAILNRGILKCVDNGILQPGLIGRFDAIEVVCGGLGSALNRRAIAFADREGTGVTGGSDAHCLAAVGSVLTCCRSTDAGGFLDEIRKQKSVVLGKGCSSLVKCATVGVIAGRYLPYTLPSLIIHYEQTVPRFRRLFGRTGRP